MNKVNPWSPSLNAAKQLFISGRHLTKKAAFVRPHIHFHQTDDAILHNLRSRGWPDPPVPVSTLRQKFTDWQSLKKMSRLDQTYKDKIWDIEEEILPIILAIPNDLCDSTPMNDNVIHAHQSNICHKDSIENKSDIELEDHFAKLELQIQNDLQEKFVNEEGFFPIMAPDFVKNPLNLDYVSNAPLQLHHFTNLLLSGGASIHSLIAFFVKNEIQSIQSGGPKIYSVGRSYDANNLIRQRILASSLLLSRSEAESLACREELVESLKEYFIKKHGIPFDIMVKGAHNLSQCESHSLLFKTKDGTVISEISSFKDYISKRLSIIYQDGTHCHLTGGTLCDVTSLILSSY